MGWLFLPVGNGFFNEYIQPGLEYYWTGSFLIAYWYIPFILITFMLSPLHILFIKSKPAVQITLILLLSLVSMLIHRSVGNLYIFQNVIYFTPVYLFGILCSEYRDKVYATLSKREPILLAIVIFLAALQAYSGVVGNYHKPPFEYGGLDIMFIQKIILCLFFMVFLYRFESKNSVITHALAATSFTVFFLHPFIIWSISKSTKKYLPTDSWMIFILYVVTIITLCVLIAKITRKILPEYSRSLIGY
jgi:hypothetical protein